MLKFRSGMLSRARTAARPETRRSRRDKDAVRPYTRRTIGAELGDSRLETSGGADGTTGAVIFGAGGGAIFAALPMPLGSLIELLRPPTLPGPCGIPLTPASCATAGTSPIEQSPNASAKNADLPNIDHLPDRDVANAAPRVSFRNPTQLRAGGAKKPGKRQRGSLPGGRGFAVVMIYAWGLLSAFMIDRIDRTRTQKASRRSRRGHWQKPVGRRHGEAMRPRARQGR